MVRAMSTHTHTYHTLQSSGSPLSLMSAHNAVYLCLSKEHRVSRSVRATWFLDNLLKDLHGDLFIKVLIYSYLIYNQYICVYRMMVAVVTSLCCP